MRERLGKVRQISEVAPGILCIAVQAVSPTRLTFRPGQFVSIAIDQHQRRSYSVAAVSPGGDGFDLLVKPVGTGATARYASELSAGDDVRFFGPMGYFFYGKDIPADVVFGATGVGISAIWSMLQAALDEQSERQLRLYWGVRDSSETFWEEQLRSLSDQHDRFQFEMCVSKNGDGHITPLVIETAGRLTRPTYFLCGNGHMIDAVTQGLVDAGISKDAVRKEAFYPF